MTVLAQKARLSVAWTTALHVFKDVVQFGLMLVLVRLLPAEAYGQFGLTNTIIGFLMVFSSREFLAHTVVVRDDGAVNYQEQFTAGCVIQGMLFLACNGVAVALRSFPAYAPVAPLLHVMSLAFIVDLPSELRVKMLERSLDWRRLRLVEAAGVASAAALTLTLALSGADVYALLLPAFAIQLAFIVDLFVVEGWRPTFAWSLARYRASRTFGLKRVLSVSLMSAASLLESGVLAKVVGYAVLGIFGRATGMAALFCQRVAFLLMTALYPVLVRISPGSDSYQRASALVLRLVTWAVVPVATMASLLADLIVHTLYGNRWESVIPLVPYAMTVGVLLAIVQAGYSLLLAHDEARKCLHADIGRLAGMAAALAIGLPLGIKAYFMALAIVQVAAFAFVAFSLAQGGGLRLGGIAGAIIPAGASALVSAIALHTVLALLPSRLPALATIGVGGLLFCTTYVLCLRVFFAPLLRELVGHLPAADRVHRLLRIAAAT